MCKVAISINKAFPKPGDEVIIFFKDSEDGPMRREQARVYYKDIYTYGYLGGHRGFGMYFAIPSIIPLFKVHYWAPIPSLPKDKWTFKKFLKRLYEYHKYK